jgi:mono/diheme cytochrome c family protein
MNEQERQEYLDGYKKAKEKGEYFFPDSLFKDAIVSLIVFLVLVALAIFVGAPLEERANPADTNYTPRPEWYFLFLFQLLKYFPGKLEFLGVVVIPTIAILLLLGLPLLDRSPKRHFMNRGWVTGILLIGIVGIVLLTILSITAAPPPSDVAQGGDQTAALYTANCASCHGPTIDVPTNTNLHEVIAEGKHEGMPAWSADLTTDQIDALAGFILSPGGSKLFTENCAECHQIEDLVATNPIELKTALNQGPNYLAHEGLDVPHWDEILTKSEQTSLLNFLVAPDGQRLFVINCSPCHGTSVAFSGERDELREIIAQGGMHLSMPAWKEDLEPDELEKLAAYVVSPNDVPGGADLFNQYCTSCHGQRIPYMDTIEEATQIIATGGPHETMPVWGQILTDAQLDALADYTYESAQGTSLEAGQEYFANYCTPCHGDFGEGGPNPTRPDDIIAPISTAEYLKTRDDFTLRSIIAQGQPNFGMSPFGSAYGGPLEDDKIDAIVAYMRSWEANPPVELPPEVNISTVSLSGAEIYANLCAQCHGPDGRGLVGPSLRDPAFRAENSAQDIFDTINLGHEATAMISWGEILTSQQIQELVDYILQFEVDQAGAAEQPTPIPGESSFANDVMPILEAKCISCHGSMGGWDAATYQSVINSGQNGPVVIPGDVENSLLAQKILGTHQQGSIMPPGGRMPESEIQPILDWIANGAPDN